MKIFLFSVLITFLASISAQEKAEKPSSEEAQIVEDDDQQILSEKKDQQSQKSHKIIEDDEELILDDSEEYLIAPANVAKPQGSTSDTSDTTKTSSITIDSATQDKKVVADSASEQTETVKENLPKPQQLLVRAKDTKVEDVKSINFAQNLKQYRSPKLAMLLSFLMPGSGQLYARHKLKAAIFGAAELTIIGTGTALAVKGRKELKKAKQFADDNYRVENFKTYYYNVFKPNVSVTLHDLIFGSGNLTIDQFEQLAQKRDNDFYRNIQGNDNPFVRGWKDVTPTFLPDFTPAEPGYKTYSSDTLYLVYPANMDSTHARFGFSKLQEEFEIKFSKANNFYDISQKVFFLLLLDRIVSAVDAGITAKAYNDEMLGKQSMWQRINIEQKQVNSGWETYSGYALVFRF